MKSNKKLLVKSLIVTSLLMGTGYVLTNNILSNNVNNVGETEVVTPGEVTLPRIKNQNENGVVVSRKLILNDDINLKVCVLKPSEGVNRVVRFTLEGIEGSYTDSNPVLDGDNLVYSFDKVTPQYMNRVITIEVYDVDEENVSTLVETYTTSVAEYLIQVLNDFQGDSLNNYATRAIGQLYIDGNLTISDGVEVNINTQKAVNGITCKRNLLISNAKLNVISKGNAVYLNGESEIDTLQSFIVDGENSDVKLIGNGYGITSDTVNKTLLFNGGKVEIVGNTGVNWSNIVLNAADVKIVAKNGYTVESSSDVYISTISEDYNIGKLSLINETPYNEWWDVNYVIKPKEMNINGGTITIEGSCRDGLIQTVVDSTFTFANCNVYVRTYQTGHGFGSSEGGTITIENTARIFVYNCDIPIGCWNKTNPIQVTIYGDFAAVNSQGQVGTWDDTTVILSGFIRYVNG